MVALTTPKMAQMNEIAFRLQSAVDRAWYSLDDVRRPNGVVLMFICNHCPYVQKIAHLFAKTSEELRAMGVGLAAIMSNDVDAYPDDSFENMAIFAREHKFDFPYLLDTKQQTARDYEAICTPDFFMFDKSGVLVYRGRIHDPANLQLNGCYTTELVAAAAYVMACGVVPSVQHPSIGCSIKWRQ